MKTDKEALAQTEAEIIKECDELRDLLLMKNASYGDSALSPLRIFSKADPVETINVRIDDKLSRIARGHEIGEDTIRDLTGYLILLRIAMKRKTSASKKCLFCTNKALKDGDFCHYHNHHSLNVPLQEAAQKRG